MTFDSAQFTKVPVQEVEINTAIMQQPGVYVNKFYMSYNTDNTIRIVFVDEDAKQQVEIIRQSIVLSIPGFIALSDALQHGATSIKDRMKSAQK